MGQVGFNGALRYTALFIGILLAGSCFLITARVPPKKWDHNSKWIDFRLFKEKQIALYCLGSFLCMFVTLSKIAKIHTDIRSQVGSMGPF